MSWPPKQFSDLNHLHFSRCVPHHLSPDTVYMYVYLCVRFCEQQEL